MVKHFTGISERLLEPGGQGGFPGTVGPNQRYTEHTPYPLFPSLCPSRKYGASRGEQLLALTIARECRSEFGSFSNFLSIPSGSLLISLQLRSILRSRVPSQWAGTDTFAAAD